MLVSFCSVSWGLVALARSVPVCPKWYKRTAVSSFGVSGFLLLCFCMCVFICLCLYVYVCLSLSLSLCQRLYVVCLCMYVCTCVCLLVCVSVLGRDLGLKFSGTTKPTKNWLTHCKSRHDWFLGFSQYGGCCSLSGSSFLKSGWFYRQPFPVNGHTVVSFHVYIFSIYRFKY